MCKYCECIVKVPRGHIGKRIGGRIYPIFIQRYEDADFLDGRYWMVENGFRSFNPDKAVLQKIVAINYCPVCGKDLHTYD